MTEPPHPNPFPSKGGGGPTPGYLHDLPKAFGAAERPHRASVTELVIAMWILAVAGRLILINQPYVDHWSWRQSDVAAIARNFFEHGFHFVYPQIDWAGGAAGYVGTEFTIKLRAIA